MISNDVCIPMSDEEAMFEASRCVHCPEPAPCVLACPAHNDIPSAMWLIEQGQVCGSGADLPQDQLLPEICGRVCPHEQLCQGLASQLNAMPLCSPALWKPL